MQRGQGVGGKHARAAIGFASTKWDFAHFPMLAAQLFDQPLPIPPPGRRWDFDLGCQLAQPTALAHGRGRSLASAVLCECTYQGHGLRPAFRLMSVLASCAFFSCSKSMAFFSVPAAARSLSRLMMRSEGVGECVESRALA